MLGSWAEGSTESHFLWTEGSVERGLGQLARQPSEAQPQTRSRMLHTRDVDTWQQNGADHQRYRRCNRPFVELAVRATRAIVGRRNPHLGSCMKVPRRCLSGLTEPGMM